MNSSSESAAETGAATRLALILAGLFGGLLLGALIEFDGRFSEPQEIGLGTLVFVFTAAFGFSAAPGRFLAAVLLASVAGLTVGGLSFKLALLTDGQGRVFDGFFTDFWFQAGAPLTAYLLTAFGLTAIEEGRPRWPFGRMFANLFGFAVQALFALSVVGLLNLLIWLWSELFEIIGIDVIGRIWEEPLLWMPMSGAFAGLGVALARQWEGITSVLRTMCRYVARFALPIYAAFTISLLIALPIQGLEALFDARSAAGIMGTLALFTLFLVYGARQDLDEAPPAWLRLSTALAVLGLPVYTALATWAVWLRVGQYGFTPERYVGLVLVLILFVHAAGLLAVQALDLALRRGWLPGAGPVNLAVLGILATFLAALHTPPLDPYAVSAQSQYDRLAEGRADAFSFDYGYLRFRLGPEGQRALERLKALESHPDSALIRSRIRLAEGAQSYWEWKTLAGRNARPAQPRRK